MQITVWISQLAGWRRWLAAFLAGVIATTALPPLDLWPALFIAIPVIIWLLDGAVDLSHKYRSSAAIGWWFGFGYFLVSLYWIGFAFMVEADKFARLLPFAVTAMPAGLALFWSLAMLLAARFWHEGAGRVFVFAISLVIFEWLRGNIATGFPWNLIGYAGQGMGYVDQFVSITGIYGLTAMVILWATTPVLFPRHKYTAIAILASLAIIWGWGYARISPVADQQFTVRIVQPNIPQKQKWDRRFTRSNIQKYFDLTSPGLDRIDLVIWPESALPLLYRKDSAIGRSIDKMLPDNVQLLMGALRRVPGKNKLSNSAILLAGNAEIIASYNKFHLVPFGEYLPFARFLGAIGISKLVKTPGGFIAGDGPQTIKAENIPAFSPLICYEAIFPGKVTAKSRPQWLVNLTNDGWFGRTAGPYQHLAQIRMRAIEEGLPVIRAANTGISAVIDPYGHVIAEIKLGTSGLLDVFLKEPLPATIFAKWGNLACLTLLFALLIVAVIIKYNHKE